MKTVFVPVFPGTNCDGETLTWVEDNLDVKAVVLNATAHENTQSDAIAAVIVPGGFSYGDYLRAGAIAARSPEMKLIKKWGAKGTAIIGICNGFQILCEAGLLPGVLVKNITRQHHHFPVSVELDFDVLDGLYGTKQWPVWLPKDAPSRTALQAAYSKFLLPMSCGMGRYIPPLPISRSKATAPTNTSSDFRVLLRYTFNENGSTDAIASISNHAGNIVGIMPHPERASDRIVGGTQGLVFLLGLAQTQSIGIRPGSVLESFAKTFYGEEAAGV